MAADLHDQLDRRTGQKFVSTERTAAGMRSNLGVFWPDDLNIIYSLLIRKFDRLTNPRQFNHFLYVLVKIWIINYGNAPVKPIDQYILGCIP